MLPRKIKYNLDVNPPKIGNEYLKYSWDRIETLLNETDNKSLYLPRTILLEDLDLSVFNYLKSDRMKLVVDNKVVNVFYLDTERWAEFSKTWKFVDDDKNIPTPYITIRRSEKQQGTRLGTKYSVPQAKTFRYTDVPIMEAGQIVYLRFKMPEPVNVDLIYDVTLFTKYRVDVNDFDQNALRNFASKQEYVLINGSPMPLHLEGFTESNPIENVDGDKFFISKYKLKLQGFIQNEKDFEINKTLRSTRIGYSI